MNADLLKVRRVVQKHKRHSTNIRPCENCRIRVDLEEHPEFLRDDCRIRCPECQKDNEAVPQQTQGVASE